MSSSRGRTRVTSSFGPLRQSRSGRSLYWSPMLRLILLLRANLTAASVETSTLTRSDRIPEADRTLTSLRASSWLSSPSQKDLMMSTGTKRPSPRRKSKTNSKEKPHSTIDNIIFNQRYTLSTTYHPHHQHNLAALINPFSSSTIKLFPILRSFFTPENSQTP